MNEVFKLISTFFNYKIAFSKSIAISVKHILLLVITLTVAKVILYNFKKIITKRLEENDKNKFDTIFSFGKWFLYIFILLITLNSIGVQLNAIFASAAALMIGIGLALQTWFQDIMTGVFIILDKSLRIGDIIEIDDKIGRVTEIRLRTTRAMTREYKTIIIPNHLYLTKSLFNWTKNGIETRVSINVCVAYGSDLELVRKLLTQSIIEHPATIQQVEPMVLFEDFGESALSFKVMFAIKNNMMPCKTQSDIRFKINKLFKENNILIPFPQRDIHIIK